MRTHQACLLCLLDNPWGDEEEGTRAACIRGELLAATLPLGARRHMQAWWDEQRLHSALSSIAALGRGCSTAPLTCHWEEAVVFVIAGGIHTRPVAGCEGGTVLEPDNSTERRASNACAMQWLQHHHPMQCGQATGARPVTHGCCGACRCGRLCTSKGLQVWGPGLQLSKPAENGGRLSAALPAPQTQRSCA